MSLTRRLFSRAASASSIAAPAALQSIIGTPSAALAGASIGSRAVHAGAANAMPCPEPTNSLIARAIKTGLLPREKALETYRRCVSVHSLDPDLASYKSFSLSARYRMQRDRIAERNLTADEQGWPNMWNLADEFRGVFR